MPFVCSGTFVYSSIDSINIHAQRTASIDVVGLHLDTRSSGISFSFSTGESGRMGARARSAAQTLSVPHSLTATHRLILPCTIAVISYYIFIFHTVNHFHLSLFSFSLLILHPSFFIPHSALLPLLPLLHPPC